MKLYELEGKKLLNKYGIPVPKGWLWNEIPPDVPFPVIAKAQVLTGGRGKSGGIVPIPLKDNLEKVVNHLLQKEINGEKVSQVYVEEKLAYVKELYVSIVIDRNTKSPVLLASKDGGVDIEQVPHDQILRITINPLLGLQPYMIKKLSLFLEMDQTVISPIIQNLWNVFIQEEAELVEINPLFVLNNSELVAGDAKVILDDAAKRESSIVSIPRQKEGFENKCLELGAVGVELEGDIAIVTSGAGLGMATFDLVSSKGGKIAALVDLGGHVIHNLDYAKHLIQQIKRLSPKGILFNYYFQVASCRLLSQAIADELGNTSIQVIVRLKGKDEEIARELLALFANIVTTDRLDVACAQVVEKVGGIHHGNHC